MQEAISRFIKEREKGLFLIDMPTGFGKTYHVLDYISKNYQNIKGKVFFITSLKKNLPFDDLKERFKANGDSESFNDVCIKVDANFESVYDNFLDITDAIPSRIKQLAEYKQLHESIDICKEFELNKHKSRKLNLTPIFDQIRQEYEPAFRMLLEKELQQYKSVEERIKQIEINKDYQWIAKIYPSVYTKKKKVLFMTIDKFILSYSTIVEPAFSFINHQMFEHSLVFIDEFDTTRETILSRNIRNGVENRVDYLNLFRQIHSALNIREFPSKMLIDSAQKKDYREKNPNYKVFSNSEIVKKFKEIFNTTYDKYNLQFSYKTSNDILDTKRRFIFNDLKYHTVYSDNSHFLNITCDPKAKQNWIDFSSEKPRSNEDGIIGLLSSLKGCIAYFQNGVLKIAYNYQNMHNESRKPGTDELTLEQAIKTVLTEFGITNEYTRFLTPLIMNSNANKRRGKLNKESIDVDNFDVSVYNKGFRYYDFVDEQSHSLQSKFYLYNFPDSPEKLLVRMCNKSRVIGISATATLDTVIGNFDLNYLRMVLDVNFYEMPSDIKLRLEQEFNDFSKDYKKVNLCLHQLDFDSGLEKSLSDVFKDSDLVQKYSEKLRRQCQDDDYAIACNVKIIMAFKLFVTDPSIRSFLCLSNRFSKEYNSKQNINLLAEMGSDICNEYGIIGDAKRLITQISSEDFDRNKNDLLDRLSKNERIFVLSTYQTIGTGQNLQYSVLDRNDLIQIGDMSRSLSEKDFDGIYLEAPTNMLTNLSFDIDEEKVIKFIYQVEFLMERGEISDSDGRDLIKSAFIKITNPRQNMKSVAYQTRSVQNAALRILIQAVGRICRTNKKNPKILLCVDNQIYKRWQFADINGRLLNPEFRKIIETNSFSDESSSQQNETLFFENKACVNSNQTNHIIQETLRKGWSDDKISIWKSLRDACLRFPTISENDLILNQWLSPLYIKAPWAISEYSYKQEHDYSKNIAIKFNNSLAQKVSEIDCRLNILMQNSEFKEFFDRSKYSTSFEKRTYIMTPPLYNNIYKGALGEVVGKYIIEKYLKIKLEEIQSPDTFELFDYKYGDIYVDFKHWKDTDDFDASVQHEKITQKLKLVNGKRALIINVIGLTNEYKISTNSDLSIVEIPMLCNSINGEIDLDIINEIQFRRFFN